MLNFKLLIMFLINLSLGYGQNVRMELDLAKLKVGSHSLLHTGYQYTRGLIATNKVLALSEYSYFHDEFLTSDLPVGLLRLSVEQESKIYPKIQLSTESTALTDENSSTQLKNGNFNIRYEILNLKQYALTAATYHTIIQLKAKTEALSTKVRPSPMRFDLVIPKVLEPNYVNREIKLPIDQISYYRSGFLFEVPFTTSIFHSMPIVADFNSINPSFDYTFSSGSSYYENKNVEVSKLQIHGGTMVNNTYSDLSTGTKRLWAISDVPIGNSSLIYYGFKINEDYLQSSFLQPGTYKTQINIQIKDETDVNINQNQTMDVQIEIPEMTEFQLGTSSVSLELNSAENYLHGVHKDYSGHVLISKNAPFQVTVRSNLSSLYFNDSEIPVSNISIGPSSEDPRINQIAELSVEPQVLIHSGQGIIDGSYNIRYSIRPSAAHQLIHVEKGRYTGLITYSITAL